MNWKQFCVGIALFALAPYAAVAEERTWEVTGSFVQAQQMLPELKSALLARINSIPIVQTLELEIVRFGDGYCEPRVARRRKYDGVFESFHGGLLMTLADSRACFAILTRTGPDTRLTTTDMNIRFLAPCLTDVTARARVIKFGRTLCPVAIDLFDAQEQLVAVAQVNYILLNHQPPAEPDAAHR